jgi:hypothetical protein
MFIATISPGLPFLNLSYPIPLIFLDRSPFLVHTYWDAVDEMFRWELLYTHHFFLFPLHLFKIIIILIFHLVIEKKVYGFTA